MKKILLKPLVKNKKLKITLRIFLFLEIISCIAILAIVGFTLLSYRTVEKWDISATKKQVENFEDSTFIKDKTYVVEGLDGINANITVSLKVKNFSVDINSYKLKINPVEDKKYTGSTELPAIEDKLKTDFNDFIEKLRVGSIDRIKIDNNQKLENISFKNIELGADDSFLVQDNLITAGKFVTNLNNCNFEASVNIFYSLESKSFYLDISNDYLNNLCTKYNVPDNPIEASCADCTFFPVDKHHNLPASYAPEVKPVDAIQGSAIFGIQGYPDLIAMYEAAKNAGHEFYLTSAYRPYSLQEDTFENWVKYEMSYGADRATAEVRANSYSARPGFSEHQLGTAADIIALECVDFDRECQPSKDLWAWLYDNAWKYGFALSYPKDKEDLTGYVFEPWHYRWIGHDLAKEYKEKYEQKSYLAEFLRNKKLY